MNMKKGLEGVSEQAEMPFAYESFETFKEYLHDVWVASEHGAKRRLNKEEKQILLDLYTFAELATNKEGSSLLKQRWLKETETRVEKLPPEAKQIASEVLLRWEIVQ